MKSEKCTSACKQKSYVNTSTQKGRIMFVGLSAKPDTNDLCPTTNTGKLIGIIEERIAAKVGIYRTNAVKCAPLDASGKLRYPTDGEMRSCLPLLLDEIESVSPKVIVPLGGQVARFLLKEIGTGSPFAGFNTNFSYETYHLPFGLLMPIHHPSYVWIYKRKQLEEYVNGVIEGLSGLAAA